MNPTRDSGQPSAAGRTMRLRLGTTLLPIVVAMFSLTACERREPPEKPMPRGDTTSSTAPTAQYPARSPSDMTDSSKAPGTDVTQKSGTETGMPGAGSGTSAGAGTGAAESTPSKEETPKGK